MVGTTETVGIKLIYNGEYEHHSYKVIDANEYINIKNDAKYPYMYDNTTKQWISTNYEESADATIELSVATKDNCKLDYTMSFNEDFDYVSIYFDGDFMGDYTGYHILEFALQFL